MANKILIKSKVDVGGVPTASQATIAELALNTFTGSLYAGTALLVDGTTNSDQYVSGKDSAQRSWIGAPILDEDDLVSDSATKLATQQSIKAYALAAAGGTMTGVLNMGTNLISAVTDPVSAQDAATKAYVDATAQGLYIHDAVVAATTGTLVIAAAGAAQTITLEDDLESGGFDWDADTDALSLDGITLAAADRVLIKDTLTANSVARVNKDGGIFTVGVLSNATVVLTRASDFDSAADMKSGAFVFVQEGGTNADSGWTMTQDAAITINTTAITWAQFSGAGQITAGVGLTKSGNTLSVTPDLTLYEDANNADVKFSIGTSATESFNVEVLNGTSNKSAEEIKISTLTAAAGGNAAKISIYIDGVEIMDIDDGGIDMASGKSVAIDGTDLTSNSDTQYTAGDGITLNTLEFNLDAGLTTVTSVLNAGLTVGRDADNVVDFATTDNVIIFKTDGTERMRADNAGVDITGALTVSGAFAPTSLAVGGGYGDTGATISATGVGTFNGALTTDLDLTVSGGDITLGAATVAGTITQVVAAADAAGKSTTITSGSALTGGTDNTGVGGALILAGGGGKGTAIGGSIIFKSAAAGSTGDAINASTDTILTLKSDLSAIFTGDATISGGDITLGAAGVAGTLTLVDTTAGSVGNTFTLTGSDVTTGSGTANRAGGALVFDAGTGTGTATSGSITFKTSAAGAASGTGVSNASVTSVTISGAGNFDGAIINGGAF